jgi:Lipid A 3-O-deacylase (PagL)
MGTGGQDTSAAGRWQARCLATALWLLAVAAGAAGAAGAAESAPEPGTAATARGPNEIGVWGGASVASSTLIGKSTDFGFGTAAFRYGRRLWSDGTLAFDWTVDAIPLALLSLDRSPDDGGGSRETVYGAGLAPLGFRIGYEGVRWCEPFFAASGGFLYFTERVPADGVKFNFTYDFGVGALFPIGASYAATFGYKYHHISNGGIGASNPGFDSNILYAGFSIFR